MTWEDLKIRYPEGTILDAPVLSKIEDQELIVVNISEEFNGTLWLNQLSENKRLAYNIFESITAGDIIRVCVLGFNEKVLEGRRPIRSVRLSMKLLAQFESTGLIKKSEFELIAHLKQLWNIAINEDLIFVGKYFYDPNKNAHAGFFKQVTLKDQIVYYPDGKQVEYFYCPHNSSLKDGIHYEFRVRLAPLNFRSEKILPYDLRVDNRFPITTLVDYTDHKGFIKDLFTRRGFTPEDAQVIAAQLKGNELALYTSTERFIFELIQNADDMPFDNSGVSVQFILEEDYLIFLHNGQPFRRGDVQAISSNGMSNKRQDTQKTGYKGIGFKSVFTDSEKVYILSGGFSFMYDKQFADYNDFKKLYHGYFDKLRPEEAAKEINRLRGKESEFTHIENIPWQIKPIWVDPLKAQEILPYSKQLQAHPQVENSRVGIALYIGNTKIKSRNYAGVLKTLFSDPRFLLFLREVKSIRLKLQSQSIKISRKESGNLIILEKEGAKGASKSEYLKSGDVFQIPINDSGFKQSGTGIRKKIIKDASENSAAEYNFLDSFNQKIEDIPTKLAKLDETVLTFAVPFSNDKLKSITSEEAIIFSYLPTADISFNLPFLINGDFVLTQNRENVIPSNLWNQHLFYYIAYFHFKWLSILAEEVKLKKTYLNILVRKRFVASELLGERKSICDSFDRGYSDGLNHFAFILTKDGQIVKSSECIIDLTGFSEWLSPTDFRKISSVEKPVVSIEIDWKKLLSPDLDISVFSAKDLIKSLIDPNKLDILNNHLQSLTEEEYLQIIASFDKTYFNQADLEKHYLFSIEGSDYVLKNLKLFRLSDGICYSIRQIEDNDLLIIHKTATFEARTIFKELGFTSSLFNIYNYPSLNAAYSEYLPTDASLFKIIKEQSVNNSLPCSERKSLFKLCADFKDIGREALRSWELFPSADEKSTTTVQLGSMAKKNQETPLWLLGNAVNESDYFPELDKYLIKDTDLFEEIILPNIERLTEMVTDYATFYLEVCKYFDHQINSPFTIQKVFFTGKQFQSRETIFFDKALAVFKNYYQLKDIILHLTELETPALEIIPFLIDKESPFYLSGSDSLSAFIVCEENETVSLTGDDLNVLLDFCILSKDKIFDDFSIAGFDSGFQILKGGGVQYYSKQTLLTEILSGTKFKLLSEQVFSDNLQQIGLLTESPELLMKITADLGFIKELAPLYWGENRDIKELYLEKLDALYLENSVTYDKQSLEFHILRLIADVLQDEDFDTNTLKEKIFIDNQQLSKLVYSDKVKIKSGDNSFVTFSLSELLPNYEGSSRTISKFSDQLTILGLIGLQSTLFSSREIKPEFVFDEISNISSFENASQIIFVGLYKPEDIKKFSLTDISKNAILDFLISNKILDSKDLLYNLTELDLSEKIYPNEYSLKNSKEILPDWILSWVEDSNSNDKIKYLSDIGLNSSGSEIVSLRTYFRGIGLEPNDLVLAKLKESGSLLANTINWLSDERIPINSFGSHIGWLKKIYELVTPNKTLPVPVVDSISSNSEIFFIQNSGPYYLCANKELRTLIFPIVRESGGAVLITDFFNASWLAIIKPKESEFVEVLNFELLKDSKEWDADFYLKFCDEHLKRVFLYNGPIPYLTLFLEHEVKSFASDVPAIDGNKIYLDKNSGDVLSIIEEHSLLNIAELKDIYRHKSGDFEINQADKDLLEKIKRISPDTDELLRLADLGKRVESYTKKAHQEPRSNNFGSEINSGFIGEQKVYERLISIYGDKRIIWVSEKNPDNNLSYGTTHDFEVLTEDLLDILLYIDVKSTITGKYDSDKIPIEIRNNEWKFFEETTNDNYIIARVFNVNSSEAEIKFLKMGLYDH